MSIHRRVAFALVTLLVCARARSAAGQDAGPAFDPSSKVAKRIVHQFHFDERREGNVEELPRYWTPLRGKDFPRFVRGSFDEAIGHAAAPSFHLESVGRNVAFQYNGPEIPVCSQSEYRIEGHVRMSGMSSSGVCVSAFFLDQDREPILDPTKRTPQLAQQPGTDWVPFELQLPAAPVQARFLGIALWVLQEPMGDPAPRGSGISLVDVSAQAWFDDISVYRLPRLELTTGAPGEVLNEHDEPALWVTLADSLGRQVEADLEIQSADGAHSSRRRLQSSVRKENSDPIRIDLSGFQPGLYDAQARVVDEGQVIAVRSIQFLILPSIPQAKRQSRAFGIVIDSMERADWKTEIALLEKNAARSVKLPIASPAAGTGAGPGRLLESYCHELLDNRFLLGATLPNHPAVASKGSLETVSSRSTEDWTSEIAVVAAQTAGYFRWWQLNEDESPASMPYSSWKSPADELRSLLHQYISLPRLGMVVSAHDSVPDPALRVEHVTIKVSDTIGLAGLSEKIADLRKQGCEDVSVYAPPLPRDLFVREARIAEWGRRLIQARHAGADVVYSSQPWHTRRTLQDVVTEPTEDFQIFHTVASMLDDAVPGPELFVGDHVRCLTFRSGEHSVVVVWDDAPPPQGRTVPLQLGAADRQVDLWGRISPLSRDPEGRQLVRVSQSPVFINNVDSWMIDLATSFTIEPAIVESGKELVQHDIMINCPAGAPRNGSGVLIPPLGIDVTPRRFSFTACEGQPVRIPVTVHYPHNEPAGSKTFMAKINLVDPPNYMGLPILIDVQTSGIEVSGQATMQHGELLLRHTIRNSSQNVANFRSIASVPGRQRQYRPISGLAPGDTQTVEFRFHEASDLIGRNVNLTLRELDDGPRQHNLLISVP